MMRSHSAASRWRFRADVLKNLDMQIPRRRLSIKWLASTDADPPLPLFEPDRDVGLLRELVVVDPC